MCVFCSLEGSEPNQWRIQNFQFNGSLSPFFFLQPLFSSSLFFPLFLPPSLLFFPYGVPEGRGAPPTPTLDPPLNQIYALTIIVLVRCYISLQTNCTSNLTSTDPRSLLQAYNGVQDYSYVSRGYCPYHDWTMN